jgi:hypothetical protein
MHFESQRIAYYKIGPSNKPAYVPHDNVRLRDARNAAAFVYGLHPAREPEPPIAEKWYGALLIH